MAPIISILILVAKLLSLFASPACSSSRLPLARLINKDVAFRVTLQHVDSNKNLTKFERIQHGMERGKSTLHKLNAMVLDSSSKQISSPIVAGSGEFLMRLSIGSPAKDYSAIIDTGSDLIWTQCKPCTKCYAQPTPIFDPSKSSSFSKLSCSSELCQSLPQSTCGDHGCEYLYTYGDYSSSQGILGYETFTFGNVSVPNIGFGCGEDNEGDGFSQGAGLVGLGRGPLSLVSQLKEPIFSYCLIPMDDTKTSTLFMGSLSSFDGNSSSMISTTLLKNPSQPSFYYISLEGISVGGTRLPIKKSNFALQDDGSGGLIIDSGTTLTYLEQSAFDLVKGEFKNQVELSVDTSGSTGLDLCFSLPKETKEVEVPTLTFHFFQGDLNLPGENYMIADSTVGVLCLAMGGSNGMSIFGNIQQQNILVTHDLAKDKLSFLPTQCDLL